MLTILSNAFRTATRNQEPFTPDRRRFHKRGPISDAEARRIEIMRQSLHYRSPW